MKLSPVFKWNVRAKAEVVINQGGTSSSKTWSILQLLYMIADHYSRKKKPVLISVVAETFPALKKGAMRDFFKMLQDEGIYRVDNHNRTDHIYHVGDSRIEFFSADDKSKVHGPRRDYLYINECNNVKFEVFEQLEIRTAKRTYLDFNPTHEFWVHNDVIPHYDNVFIKSTYKDNPYLSDKIIRGIERWRETNPNKWRIYGEGEVGNIEGLIFPEWSFCEELPDGYKWRAYGLDFGFTNDPTALIEGRLAHGELWFDEVIYEPGLTNSDISERMILEGVESRAEIIADSAEPKSIEDLTRLKWRVRPAVKGKDSIVSGIDLLQRYKLNITKRSTNLAKELRNYTWKQNRDGNYINEPVDDFNHAIDAIRYLASVKARRAGGVLAVKVF